MDSDDMEAKERAALDQKAEDPKRKVLCPRCGKELIYHAVGNSYEIKCPTPNCLHECVRGL